MQSENAAGATETIEGQEPNIEHLGELLAEDEVTEAPGGDDGGEGGSQEETTITKFNDLAGQLGMELDELYGLEVSQAEDGTPVTIENLKDHYARHDDLSLREIEFEERKTKTEADLLQAQEELRELMASLPEGAVKPEVLAKVKAKHDAQMKLERARTLDVIPEWKDEDTRKADMEGMSDHLQQYGYPVDHLERVADHKQIKYIRDNYLREKRIRKALAKVKAGKPDPSTRSKPAKKAPVKRPVSGIERGNARDKLEAVFSNVD